MIYEVYKYYASVKYTWPMLCYRWIQHPKIRENWKVVLGAVMLTLIGSVLFFVGIGIVASPGRGRHG